MEFTKHRIIIQRNKNFLESFCPEMTTLSICSAHFASVGSFVIHTYLLGCGVAVKLTILGVGFQFDKTL